MSIMTRISTGSSAAVSFSVLPRTIPFKETMQQKKSKQRQDNLISSQMLSSFDLTLKPVQKMDKSKFELGLFNYNNQALGLKLSSYGDVWYQVVDICNILKVADISSILTIFSDDEKRIENNTENVETTFINDSGFYRLIFHVEKNDPSIRVEELKLKEWIKTEIMKRLQTCHIPYTETRSGPIQFPSLPEYLKNIYDCSQKHSVIFEQLSGVKVAYIIHLYPNMFVFGVSDNIHHTLSEYKMSFWPNALIVKLHPVTDDPEIESTFRKFLAKSDLLRNNLCFIEDIETSNTFMITTEEQYQSVQAKFASIMLADTFKQALKFKQLEAEKKKLEDQLNNQRASAQFYQFGGGPQFGSPQFTIDTSVSHVEKRRRC